MYRAARHDGAPGAPLVLTFHGTGGDERQFHGFAVETWPGAHVVSPRGDVSEGGALRYFRRTGEGVYDMDDLARRTAAMSEFIAGEVARTGASEVWGMGYSNGANILASVSFARPGLVGRLILLHPLIPFAPTESDMGGTKVLITAGRRDPICPPALSQRLADWYGARGADVRLDWHPGGHEIAASEVAAIRAMAGQDV
jgi:phospholipase/carboxylesterase